MSVTIYQSIQRRVSEDTDLTAKLQYKARRSQQLKHKRSVTGLSHQFFTEVIQGCCRLLPVAAINSCQENYELLLTSTEVPFVYDPPPAPKTDHTQRGGCFETQCLQAAKNLRHDAACAPMPDRDSTRLPRDRNVGLCPSSGILENRKHDVSETASLSVLK
jgi:hypothetical protein